MLFGGRLVPRLIAATPPHYDICEIKLLGFIKMPWSRSTVKGAVGPPQMSEFVRPVGPIMYLQKNFPS